MQTLLILSGLLHNIFLLFLLVWFTFTAWKYRRGAWCHIRASVTETDFQAGRSWIHKSGRKCNPVFKGNVNLKSPEELPCLNIMLILISLVLLTQELYKLLVIAFWLPDQDCRNFIRESVVFDILLVKGLLQNVLHNAPLDRKELDAPCEGLVTVLRWLWNAIHFQLLSLNIWIWVGLTSMGIIVFGDTCCSADVSITLFKGSHVVSMDLTIRSNSC